MTAAHELFVTEGLFAVLDGGIITTETADWSNGLAAPMAQGAFILTGINTGHVRLEVRVQDDVLLERPDDRWEEVVEVSLHSPTGCLRVESLELGPLPGAPSLSPAGPAWYRLRVHARGRETLRDKVSTEPVEDYLLLAWPAPRTATVVLKTSERIELRPRTEKGRSAPIPVSDFNPPIRKPD